MPNGTSIMRAIKKCKSINSQLDLAQEIITKEALENNPSLLAKLTIWISTKVDTSERDGDHDTLSKKIAKTLMAIIEETSDSLVKLSKEEQHKVWVIKLLAAAMACINKSVHSQDKLRKMIEHFNKCEIPLTDEGDKELTPDEVESLINLGTFSYGVNVDGTKLVIIKG